LRSRKRLHSLDPPAVIAPLSISAIILALVALFFLRRSVRREIRGQTESTQICRCGYTLANLTVPRCPECGRVVGFDATAEQLGLSREELERAQSVHDQRERQREQTSKI
jgi:hypothetical protein